MMNNEQRILGLMDNLYRNKIFAESISDVFHSGSSDSLIGQLHQEIVNWYESEIRTIPVFTLSPFYKHQFEYLLTLNKTVSNNDELNLKKSKWIETAISIKTANLLLHELSLCDKPTVIYHRMSGYFKLTHSFYKEYRSIDATNEMRWLCTQICLLHLLDETYHLSPLLLKLEQGIWRKNYQEFIQSLYIN
jgi:hypothetical protein